MGTNNTKAAIELMERAWTTGSETMMSPPGPKAELQQIVDKVYRDLVEAVAICCEVGAQRELVHALRKLGHVEQDLGRNDATRALYEEAVSIVEVAPCLTAVGMSVLC